MRLSFVISAYNVEDYIERCLSSILCFNSTDFEVIVVNDCSTDDTPSKIKAFKDYRVKVVNHFINKGCGEARISGLKAATGDYIWFVDADDYLPDGAVKRALEMTNSGADLYDVKRAYIHADGKKYTHTLDRIDVKGKYQMYYGSGKSLLTKIIKREIWNKVGYSNNRYIEDYPSLWKAIYMAQTIEQYDEVLYCYSIRQGSLSNAASDVKNNVWMTKARLDIALFDKEHFSGQWLFANDYLRSYLRYFFQLVDDNEEYADYADVIEEIRSLSNQYFGNN